MCVSFRRFFFFFFFPRFPSLSDKKGAENKKRKEKIVSSGCFALFFLGWSSVVGVCSLTVLNKRKKKMGACFFFTFFFVFSFVISLVAAAFGEACGLANAPFFEVVRFFYLSPFFLDL